MNHLNSQAIVELAEACGAKYFPKVDELLSDDLDVYMFARAIYSLGYVNGKNHYAKIADDLFEIELQKFMDGKV